MLYNVVLVSDIYQHESALGIRMLFFMKISNLISIQLDIDYSIIFFSGLRFFFQPVDSILSVSPEGFSSVVLECFCLCHMFGFVCILDLLHRALWPLCLSISVSHITDFFCSQSPASKSCSCDYKIHG